MMKPISQTKNNLLILALTSVCIFLQSCSSSAPKSNPEAKDQKISDEIKKDYKVIDASSGTRPGWIVDATDWARANNYDLKNYRYFSYETEPKVSREIACQLAKAHAKSDIAGEIATFLKQTLGSSEEGQASIDPNNPITQPLRSFLESNLTEKIQEVIVGAQIAKTHWEKRSYLVDLGARRDFIGFTCASFIQIKDEFIQSAIDLARSEMLNRTSDKSMKEKVTKALSDAEKQFDQMRGLGEPTKPVTAPDAE